MSSSEWHVERRQSSNESPLSRDLENAPETGSLSIVVLGASGDLAKKKTFPALFHLYVQGFLPPNEVCIFGYARTKITDNDLRNRLRGYLVPGKDSSLEQLEEVSKFLNLIKYVSGSYDSKDGFCNLDKEISEHESLKSSAQGPSRRLFYLALPPTVYPSVCKMIKTYCMNKSDLGGWTRIVVEKPFGKDLESAEQLSTEIGELFEEPQIYRIDHYLGKELVQNMLVLRFANRLFMPQWNRDNIANVQIVFREDFGTEGRGGYFDQYGIIRDIIQNRVSEWDLIADHRAGQQGANRIANLYSSVGLQRQSSGSSYGESSLSGGGDFYAPTLSTAAASDVDAFGYFHDERSKFSDAPARIAGSFGKSWAQQTEESYQLQLALALRLSSDATCADDPNFLDPMPDDGALRLSSSAEAVSHRFWVNGCLSYSDKIPDGFYLIHGMDSFVWTVCTDLHENGRIPSVDMLKSVNPSIVSSVEVVLVDQNSDPSLRDLQNRAHNISCSSITTSDVVDQLSKLVCNRMGGSASVGEDNLVSIWRDCMTGLHQISLHSFCFLLLLLPTLSLLILLRGLKLEVDLRC